MAFDAESTHTATVSTIEIVRAAWPIVLFLISLVWALINLYFKVQQLMKEYEKFRTQEYREDKSNLLNAMRELNESHRASEKRLEDKIDGLRNSLETKVDKISETIARTNLVLAEIKGRSYSKSQHTNNLET